MKITIEFDDKTKREYHTGARIYRNGMAVIKVMHPDDAEFCHIEMVGGEVVKPTQIKSKDIKDYMVEL